MQDAADGMEKQDMVGDLSRDSKASSRPTHSYSSMDTSTSMALGLCTDTDIDTTNADNANGRGS